MFRKLLIIMMLIMTESLAPNHASAYQNKWFYLKVTSIGCPDESTMQTLARMIERQVPPFARDIYAAQNSCFWVGANMYGIRTSHGDKLFVPLMLGREGNITGRIVWLPRGLLHRIPAMVEKELNTQQ